MQAYHNKLLSSEICPGLDNRIPEFRQREIRDGTGGCAFDPLEDWRNRMFWRFQTIIMVTIPPRRIQC